LNTLNVPMLPPSELARRIDHAVLKPSSSLEELRKAVRELEELNLRCLIVTPTLAPEARALTKKCVGAVAGFPYGYHPIQAKLKEIEYLAALGLDEIDYVMNTQMLMLKNVEAYAAEARAVSELCKNLGVKCKLIIETPLLDNMRLIMKATEIILANIDTSAVRYIKTSTGFTARPTYPEDVLAIRKALNKHNVDMGVKAAGGIRTALQALLLIAVGANIIGTSKPATVLSSLSELSNQ